MPALTSARNPLRALAGKTAQSVATASATLRRALARLVTDGGEQPGPERRTR